MLAVRSLALLVGVLMWHWLDGAMLPLVLKSRLRLAWLLGESTARTRIDDSIRYLVGNEAMQYARCSGVSLTVDVYGYS
jgi:hypothetical protein